MRVELKAIVGGVRVDRDGETKITLEIPLNQLSEAVKLLALHQRTLHVTLVPVESGVIGGRAVDGDA